MGGGRISSCARPGNFLDFLRTFRKFPGNTVILPSPYRKRFPPWANAKLPYRAWENCSGQCKGFFRAQKRKITMTSKENRNFCHSELIPQNTESYVSAVGHCNMQQAILYPGYVPVWTTLQGWKLTVIVPIAAFTVHNLGQNLNQLHCRFRCRLLLLGLDNCLYPAAESYCLDMTSACIQLQGPTTCTGQLPVYSCRFLRLGHDNCLYPAAGSSTGTGHLPLSSCRVLYWDRTPAFIQLQGPLQGQETCLYPAAGSSCWDRTPAFIQLQGPSTGTGQLPVSSCRVLILGQDNCLYPQL
jgi:hypothetical protein